MPVVLDNHQFIRDLHLTFIPCWQRGDLLGERQAPGNILRGGPAIDQALQQRVRRHTIRAVQPGVANFADGV